VAQAGAQEATGTISGRVVDSTSQQPLAGVTVRISGTQRGALTQADGAFILPGVPAGPQPIQANRIGYAAQQQQVTVTAGGTATVQFRLRPVAASLNEVVVVGYGTQRRNAITGAVSTVNAEQANVGVVPNVNNLIQGRAAGVNVTVNSGEPGAGAQIRIRGGTSISASNEPLYVIDGVPIQNANTETGGVGISGNTAALPRNPLNLINPADVANITILKDAAATAIYGSRGANGVVLIETKKGAAGTTTVEYDGYIGASTASRELETLNGDEYRAFIRSQIAAGALPANREATLGTANTDWEDEITRTGIAQNHNVSFSGGTRATQYRASLNYFDQQGVVLANGLQRYQGRINGTTRAFNDKLQLGLNLTSSQVRNKYLATENTGGFEGGVFTNAVTFNPTRPIRVSDSTTGSPTYFELAGQTAVRNPVALAEELNDRANTTRTLGNITAAYSILPTLTASANIGVDRSSGLRQTYFPAANPVGSLTNGLARQANRNVSTATAQTLLTLNQPIGDNQTLEVVGGYEYSETRLGDFAATAQNFLTDAFAFNNLGAGAQLLPPVSSDTNRVLASVFSRVNYGIRDKYFLTGVIRRDGSSVFGPNNKYAVFPAISGSWRVSEESFMENTPFSDLRLRAGYGLQGNQAITPYGSLILLGTNQGARYTFGNTVVTGVVPSQNANPDLKWETTAQTNIAADYGFFGDRLTGSVEYYVKNTKDLLLSVDVAQPAPVQTQLQNIGRVRNRGFEASMDGQIINEVGRNWTAGLVLSVERNKVVDLGGRQFIPTGQVSGQGQSGQRAQRILPGQPIGTFFGPEFAGINAEGKQLFNKYTVTRDANGREVSRVRDGTTLTPGGDDNVILGNANPNFSLGKFDGSFLLRAVQGGKVFNNTALVYADKNLAVNDNNFLRSALNDGLALREPAVFSSRYIEDGSFVRLQNVTVGYTFDLGRIRGGAGGGSGSQATTARFYLSADNLFLLTDYSGYDPEVFTDALLASRNVDYLTYPRARTFTAGVRLGL
jgi:iron complex outermembrane receptor protein